MKLSTDILKYGKNSKNISKKQILIGAAIGAAGAAAIYYVAREIHYYLLYRRVDQELDNAIDVEEDLASDEEGYWCDYADKVMDDLADSIRDDLSLARDPYSTIISVVDTDGKQLIAVDTAVLSMEYDRCHDYPEKIASILLDGALKAYRKQESKESESGTESGISNTSYGISKEPQDKSFFRREL